MFAASTVLELAVTKPVQQRLQNQASAKSNVALRSSPWPSDKLAHALPRLDNHYSMYPFMTTVPKRKKAGLDESERRRNDRATD